jgi:uncharacterized protein (AIM24 family)
MQPEIKGTTMPVLEIGLNQGEHVLTPHGELAWMSAGVSMSQTMGGDGGGGGGGFMKGLKRMLGGGGLLMTRYEGPGTVAFAAKLPGHIVPVEIGPGQGYLVHRHGWLCGTDGITPTVGLQQSFRGGMFGGDGFVLQRLEGQGVAWIELGGEMITYNLQPGQTVLVHPGHVGMFQDSVQFSISQMPGISNKFFGADGLYLVALTGPGRVWLQSMPVPVLAHAIQPYLPTAANGDNALSGGSGGGFGGFLSS